MKGKRNSLGFKNNGLTNAINKIWRKIEKNWKKVIVGIIVVWFLGKVLDNTIGPKVSNSVYNFGVWAGIVPTPIILSNVVVIKNFNTYSTSIITKIRTDTSTFDVVNDINFSKSYGPMFMLTRRGTGTLYFMDTTAMKQLREYPIVIMQTSQNFTYCPNCVYYLFKLENLGNKKADEITIDIKTAGHLRLYLDDPKILKKECGGIFESKGCRITIGNLAINDKVNFALEGEDKAGIEITCTVDGQDYCKFEQDCCKFKRIEVYAQEIPPSIRLIH